MIGSILKIISLGLKLTDRYFSWKEKKSYEDTGRIKEQKRYLEEANAKLRRAIVARRATRHSKLPDDYKYYRE